MGMTDRVVGTQESQDGPQQRLMYELYGISNHMGGLGGGHYTAYAKRQDGEWYEFDDSRVTKMKVSDCITDKAYVLFYRRIKASSNEELDEIIKLIESDEPLPGSPKALQRKMSFESGGP